MEDQTNPLFLLYSIAIAQFLLLIFVVFKKRKHKVAELILFLSLIVCLILIIAEFLLTWSGYLAYFPSLMGISFALPFLFGPIFYGLMRKSEENKFGYLDFLHLLPFALAIIYQFSFNHYSSVEKLEYYENEISTEKAFSSLNYIIGVFIKAIHLGGYVVWASWYWTENKASKNLINKSIYYVFYSVSILLFIHGTLLLFGLPMYALTYCIIMGLLGILGFGLQWIFLFPPTISLATAKYQNSGLSDNILKKEGRRILEKMKEDQPFLNPDLTLSKLSETMVLSPHHLSQIINQEIGKNFAEFVNGYRIEHAQNLLKSESSKTIQEIAYASGFNSKNSFNRSFKKYVGTSPSEFKSKVQL